LAAVGDRDHRIAGLLAIGPKIGESGLQAGRAVVRSAAHNINILRCKNS